jgi:hypothetical protein
LQAAVVRTAAAAIRTKILRIDQTP